MQRPSILEAKINELEDAFIVAIRRGDVETARMYNAELIPLLIRLIDVVGTTESDPGSDSRK